MTEQVHLERALDLLWGVVCDTGARWGELRYAIQSTEPRITGRQPDLLGGPGTWAHDVLGVTLADSGGGVVMPEPVEPIESRVA